MTAQEPRIVNVKVLSMTRDVLQRSKKPLNAKNIDDVIQRYLDVAKQVCFLLDFNDPTQIGNDHPCDCADGDEEPFNYRQCPSICPSYKNMKMTPWWSTVAHHYNGVVTKEGYIEEHLKSHRQKIAGYEADVKHFDEQHTKDPNLEVGEFETSIRAWVDRPEPTRGQLESNFKYIVERNKALVLKMEKLRHQSLFAEWKRLWNYPTCIEGIITVEEPKDDGGE